MMDRRMLRLVLVVSAAHALVHVFELSLPSVELRIAHDYGVGTEVTGLLSTCWRLPWGLGALAAGWLVDRFGAERMLTIYLLGCAATCLIVSIAIPLGVLFVVMFAMGTFACIYHPAGLALISHATTLENRPRALGVHGVCGSAGIGLSPFLAGALLTAGFTWRQYYLVLAGIGALLGTVFLWRVRRQHQPDATRTPVHQAEQDAVDWRSFGLLTSLALAQGFVYAAVLSFLPRFLGHWQFSDSQMSAATRGSYLTGAVLLAGCLGQFLAGKFARARILELQLAMVSLSNVPFLLAMGVTHDAWRVAATGMFAVVHFMHQPLYNSLIAKYTPRHRRSLCYGFSFAVGAGLGSVGAAFHGFSHSNLITYTTLAFIAALASAFGMLLWRRERLKHQ